MVCRNHKPNLDLFIYFYSMEYTVKMTELYISFRKKFFKYFPCTNKAFSQLHYICALWVCVHLCVHAWLCACVKRTLSSPSAAWPLRVYLLAGSSVSLRSLINTRTYFHACMHGLLAFSSPLSRFPRHAGACSFHLRQNQSDKRRKTMGIVDNDLLCLDREELQWER